MIITGTQLQTMRRAFNAAFNKALLADPTVSLEPFATSIPMPTSVVELGMIKAIPGLRQWVGDRVFHRLAAHGYTMAAKTYEDGIEVERSFIEDDNLGLFLSSMEQLGIQARQHPDDLLSALLSGGSAATALAYDGQPFFSSTHPERNAAGVLGTASNITAGAGPAWYLVDASKPVRPLIVGHRTQPEFVAQDAPDSDAVFLNDSVRYGVRKRTGVQYGLWQLAYRHEGTLDATNLETAVESMMARTDDSGRNLGVRPTHLIVPTNRWSEGRALVEVPTLSGGAANPNYQFVKLVVHGKLPLV